MSEFWAGPGGRFHLPTTLSGAQFCVLIGVFGMRAAAAVSIAVSTIGGLAVSPHPTLYLLAGALAVGDCLVYGVRILQIGRAPGPGWLVFGTVVASCTLLAAPLILPWSGRHGAWLDWPPQFALLIAFNTAATARTRRGCVPVPLLLAASFLLVSIPPSPGYLATTATTVLTLLGVPFVTRTVTEGLLDLGREADHARATAAEVARESVRARHRLLLKDAAGLLRMLSSESMTPAIRAQLNEQVAVEIARIRSLLSDSPVAAPTNSLVGVVVRACGAYTDLPLELSIDLAAGVELDEALAAATADVMTGAFENIRRGAAARLVVVHASAGADGSWELTIRDDGPGLEPDRIVAGGPTDTLRLHRATVTVHSVPGDGTVVVLEAAGRSGELPARVADRRYPGDSGFTGTLDAPMLIE